MRGRLKYRAKLAEAQGCQSNPEMARHIYDYPSITMQFPGQPIGLVRIRAVER